MKRFEKYYKWIVAFVFAVAVIAVYKTFDNFSRVADGIGMVLGAMKPFFIAFIIAYIINMPAKRLQGCLLKINKPFFKNHAFGISILFMYVIALVAAVLILRMLIPALYRNILDLYNNFPEYITAFQNYIGRFEAVQKLGLGNMDINILADKLFGSIDMAQFGKYAQGVFNVTSGLFDIFVAVIASIYMLIDKERLQKAVRRIMGIFLKGKNLSSVTLYASRINEIFTNYIYSRLVCSGIMAIVCSIVLMIMKVKYALILGIFIGAMDMIPYFGSIISWAVALLVSFITGGPWKGVWVGIVLLVLQQIDGNILGPKITGNSLEVRPLWIIFAVSVGGALFGFIGMLISVPVIAIIRIMCSDFLKSREMMNKLSEERADNGR